MKAAGMMTTAKRAVVVPMGMVMITDADLYVSFVNEMMEVITSAFYQKYTTQVIRHIIRTSEWVCSLWASIRWLAILVIQEVQRSLRGSVWWDSRNYFIYNSGPGYQINPLCASCATWHYWSNIIVWGNGLVPAGTKPLPQTMLFIVNWTLNKKLTSIKVDNFSSIKMQLKSLSVKLQPFAWGLWRLSALRIW